VNRTGFVIWWLLSAVLAGAAEPNRNAFDRATARVNDEIINHDYWGAESLAIDLASAYPESAGAPLELVVTYYTWIDDYGIADSLKSKFLGAVAQTISLADQAIARNHDEAYAHFYRGSALAYRAIFRSYKEGVGLGNVFGIVGDARAGIEEMKLANQLDPSFADPLVGIGKYLHWKSDKFPRPFASPRDARDGIAMLERAIRMGPRWPEGAAQALGWIYITEKRWDDAINLVSPLVARYPRSRFYLEIVARAYEGKGQYQRSEQIYQDMLDNLTPRERANDYMVMKYQRWIAELALEEGDYERACRTALPLTRLSYRGIDQGWLDRKKRLVDDVIQEACPKAQSRGR